MKLDTFNPSTEDIISMNDRLLWSAGDIWKTDKEGIPHQHIHRDGSKLTVKIPEEIPMKYKGRKMTSIIIWCNACELVTGIESHYGRPDAGGYAVAYDENFKSTDVTNYYKGGK